MIVGIVNSKGGVGKTTSAIFLATALSRRDLPVAVIDLDPQGSATDWSDMAFEDNNPLPFRVEFSSAKRLPRTLHEISEEFVVILDTPPGDPESIEAAIEVSDFVVVPTQASGIELKRVWDTLPFLAGTAHAVLITSARLGTKHLEETLRSLREAEVPVFRNIIPIRNDIRAAFGTVPFRLHGYQAVANEILRMVR